MEGETIRWPARSDHRLVPTAQGERRISVADGYRVILLTGPRAPFVNLKIEKSSPGQFAADREGVLAQMQALSDRRLPPAKALQISMRDGVEIFALDQPSINVRGPISFYTLLVARADLIATAHVLNQTPDVRTFSTMAEYEVLRERFIDELVLCLKEVRQ